MWGAALSGPTNSGGTAGPLRERCWGRTVWDFPPGGLLSRKVTIVGNSFSATSSQAQQTIPLWRDWDHPSSFLFFSLLTAWNLLSSSFLEVLGSGGLFLPSWTSSDLSKKMSYKQFGLTIHDLISFARVLSKISPVHMLSLHDYFWFRCWHWGSSFERV